MSRRVILRAIDYGIFEGFGLALCASGGTWLVLVVSAWCETMLGDSGGNWLVVLLCVCVASRKTDAQW